MQISQNWHSTRIVLLSLLAMVTLAVPAFGHKPATIRAKVTLETGMGGVTFNLYRVQGGCCDECRKPPARPCRKCGCPIAAAIDSVTLRTSGVVEFKNIPPGTYLIENEIGGKAGGYEAIINVKANKDTLELGNFTVDRGQPFLPLGAHP